MVDPRDIPRRASRWVRPGRDPVGGTPVGVPRVSSPVGFPSRGSTGSSPGGIAPVKSPSGSSSVRGPPLRITRVGFPGGGRPVFLMRPTGGVTRGFPRRGLSLLCFPGGCPREGASGGDPRWFPRGSTTGVPQVGPAGASAWGYTSWGPTGISLWRDPRGALGGAPRCSPVGARLDSPVFPGASSLGRVTVFGVPRRAPQC